MERAPAISPGPCRVCSVMRDLEFALDAEPAHPSVVSGGRHGGNARRQAERRAARGGELGQVAGTTPVQASPGVDGFHADIETLDRGPVDVAVDLVARDAF